MTMRALHAGAASSGGTVVPGERLSAPACRAQGVLRAAAGFVFRILASRRFAIAGFNHSPLWICAVVSIAETRSWLRGLVDSAAALRTSKMPQDEIQRPDLPACARDAFAQLPCAVATRFKASFLRITSRLREVAQRPFEGRNTLRDAWRHLRGGVTGWSHNFDPP
jgi:hypothetical protein